MSKKPKGWDAYTPEKVKSILNEGGMYQANNKLWYPARPEPFYSILERLRFAWDVFTYKADPFYWYFEKGYKRTSNGLEEVNQAQDVTIL